MEARNQEELVEQIRSRMNPNPLTEEIVSSPGARICHSMEYEDCIKFISMLLKSRKFLKSFRWVTREEWETETLGSPDITGKPHSVIAKFLVDNMNRREDIVGIEWSPFGKTISLLTNREGKGEIGEITLVYQTSF